MKASDLAAAMFAVEENAELLKGETGVKGEVGERGPQGPQGPEGPEGPQGIRGPIGPQGIPGPKGPKGDKGDLGLTGDKGDTGPQGRDGNAGRDGTDGKDGKVGPRGPSGIVRGGIFGGGSGGGGGAALSTNIPLVESGTGSAGSGTLASKDDHVHPAAAGGAGVTYGTPAIVLGTAAAAGSIDEAIRRDSTIVAFDATVPSTQAFSDAGAAGSAVVAARRDHKHAMMAAPVNIAGNAATVTTNANLTGDVTSSGNATTIGSGKVTEAMQVLANNSTQNVSTSKHGYAPILPNDATKYLDGTGAYSTPASGGISLPTFVQMKNSGTANTNLTLTMDAAPANGNVILLGSFSNGSAGLTTVVQTNVTWTKVATGTTLSSTVLNIWVGVAAGSAAALITITRAGGNAVWTVVEYSGLTVTPTGGTPVTSNDIRSPAVLPATTANHLIAVAGGGVSQNAAAVSALHCNVPMSGMMIGMAAIAVGYSLGKPAALQLLTADGAGGSAMIVEIT